MNELSKKEFKARKKHPGLVIFGTGYSLNWIKPPEWDVINNKYDTWGMNWFCKWKKPTTWYMVREQASTPKRLEPMHELHDFYWNMALFESSVKVVKDMHYRTNNYQFTDNLEKLGGDGYVFMEIPGKCSVKDFRDDIFEAGIHHGKCSLFDALHFAVGMGYEKVLLAGIDLYDNRHFYLGYDENLKLTEIDGNLVTDPHLTADRSVALVQDFVNHWKIPTFVQNPKSLLAQVVPVWDGK